MANVNAQIVSQLKIKLAEARQDVAKFEAALVAFGGSVGAGSGNGATSKGKRGGGVKAGYKPVAAIQAAGDARAVKAGTATPEQVARYNERQAQKALKASAKAPEAEVVSGGKLAAAAS